jgi:hypothetical protein
MSGELAVDVHGVDFSTQPPRALPIYIQTRFSVVLKCLHLTRLSFQFCGAEVVRNPMPCQLYEPVLPCIANR